MAEQAPPVQNKGMLVVAVVLGVAAVIVYNVQIAAVRSEAVGKQVTVYCFERDMKAGDKIAAIDLSKRLISEKVAEGLNDVMIIRTPDEEKIVQSGVLQRNVRKGNYFSTSMITTNEPDDPARKIITSGNVLRVIPLRAAPGNVLRPGARVNLIALIPTTGRPERIIEDVYVHAVGGYVPREVTAQGPGGGDEGMATYRNITIEVSQPASLELEQVLARVGGGVDVEVLKPDDPRSPRAGQVKPGLIKDLEPGVAPPARGASGGAGGSPR